MASSSDTPRTPGGPEPESPDPAATGSGTPPADASPQDRPQEWQQEKPQDDTPEVAREGEDAAPAEGGASDGGIEDAEVIAETSAEAPRPETAEDAGMSPVSDGDAAAAAGDPDSDTTTEVDAGRPEDSTADSAGPQGLATEAALLAGAGAAAGAAAAPDPGRGRDTATPRDRTPAPEPARSGFMPLVLGGAVAAALGAGVLWYLDNAGILRLSGAGVETVEAVEAGLATQSARIDGLAEDLAAQAERIAGAEDAAAAAAPAGMVEALAGRVDGLEGGLGRIDEALESLQALPIASDPEAMGILERYRGEIAALREEVAALMARSDGLIAAAETEAARADAAEAQLDGIAEEAAAAETRARARAALRLVETAFASGGPFAAALDDIAAAGITPPEGLAPLAADGVPTHAALQAAYPEDARAALDIALRDVQDRPLTERMTAFLRLQFGVRSLSPRDGADADAVLSRAEAALRAGDLDGTLAELAALPEAVRAPLAGWIDTVETRRAAEAGLAALTAEVESL